MDKLSCFKQTALISALMLEITQVAQAATINVDGTNCTLHDAIVSANSDAATGGCVAGNGSDELQLSPTGHFDLQSPLPYIDDHLTIHGNGSTIRRIDTAPAFSILEGGFIDLTLNETTITGGMDAGVSTANRGGGISLIYGTLTINNSVITGNSGGGVYIYGTNNSSINNSVIVDNSGSQSANRFSAGLSIVGGEMTISHSTIANNTNYGTAGGAGLYVRNAYFYGANIQINNSTISGNSSLEGGGGLHTKEVYYYLVPSSTVVTLNQTTVVGNSTHQDGGAIFNGSDAQIVISQSIISGNTGGNLVNEIMNSSGTVTTNNFNLIGLNGQAGVVGVNLGVTDAVPLEANLSDIVAVELQDNGGLTPTHALNQLGPAVDFIPEGSCQSNIDQTGKPRPLDGSGNGVLACDVGAFEYSDLIFEDGFDG